MSITTADLADPTTRGEDLLYNYRLATAIAPARCDGCARYHVNWTLGRTTRIRSPYGSDREVFAETADALIRERARISGSISILVLGTADTGVPALLAHAALRAGIIAHTEIVVVDRCDTPLQLCRDFGLRHGLNLTTCKADVAALEGPAAADLVVVHSLLRFIPPSAHADCLRRWQRFVKPGGRMLLSNTFAARSGEAERGAYTDGLRALVEQGAVELAEPKETFLARLDQPPPWQVISISEGELHDRFRKAGLTALSLKTIRENAQGRGRVIAVFA